MKIRADFEVNCEFYDDFTMDDINTKVELKKCNDGYITSKINFIIDYIRHYSEITDKEISKVKVSFKGTKYCRTLLLFRRKNGILF